MFDLSSFELTTPMPKPGGKTALTVPGKDIGRVAEFAFYDAGQLLLWAPTTGASTESVKRTRCELKGEPFYLADAPIHRASLHAKVERVNWYGEFVVLQAHCDDGNDPTLKTFIETEDGNTGSFNAGLRTKASTTAPKKVTVYPGLDLSRPFTATINITKAGLVTLTVVQDRTETLTGQLEPARAARPHVFHWGVYNQVDKGNAKEPAGDGTLLRIIDPPQELHGEEPIPAKVDFNALLDAAAKLTGTARKVELQRITDLIDDSDLSDADQGPLYTRIKSMKK